VSEFDKALGALEARRAEEEAERKRRRTAACAFLKGFYEADVAPSRKLKEHGIAAYFDGARLVLERPDEGAFFRRHGGRGRRAWARSMSGASRSGAACPATKPPRRAS